MVYVLISLLIIAAYIIWMQNISSKKGSHTQETVNKRPNTVSIGGETIVSNAIQTENELPPLNTVSQTSELTITSEFQAVKSLLQNGKKVILVTGGAGTGKTTLIQWLRNSELPITQKCAVVAFTGIAALVGKGKTIHSFFRLGLGVLCDDTWEENNTEAFVTICRNLDLLIIDEISMVRADLIDAIDRRLREARRSNESFGGVSILMVGDPCQLPPIVKQEEQVFFKSSSIRTSELVNWNSPWFFHANVFSRLKFAHVKLTTVFRQEPEMRSYIEQLNEIRKLALQKRNIDKSLSFFNKECYLSKSLFNDLAISITFTRKDSNAINSRNLRALQTKEYSYDATASGIFIQASEASLPADATLTLKVGAQVMMLANDAYKRYVNGSIGIVKQLSDYGITVELDNGVNVEVERYSWISYTYKYNDETDSIEQEEDGRFTQYPVTLAWAFTAHKAQGKTLNKVNIILDKAAFAPGQTYVALSRTRKIQDMRFSAPLQHSHFRTDEILNQLVRFLEPNDNRT
ncbi:MAG: AAA family ATPase [Akkermansia sp.]|nr:AAA family ATPase [Akkermansia sp.]